jgi:type VI secretion system protein ImpA
MASPAVIDLEALLAPIEGDSPVGTDIRAEAGADSPYYRLKDARNNARTAERRLLASEDPEEAAQVVPEWRDVLTQAPAVLAGTAKDLEVAAWYTEALIRTEGFAGLRDGIRLMQGLVDQYWDDLFPLPDEDGLETRVAPVTGLNGEEGEGTLIAPIQSVPITDPGGGMPYAAWHFEQATEIAKIADPEKRQARISSGGASMERIEQAAANTPGAFWTTLREDLAECLEAWGALSDALDERCGTDAPPASNVRNALKRVVEIVGFIAPEQAAKAAPAAAEKPAAKAATAAAGAPIAGGAISDREDAHAQLLRIAEFFRRTEPHSPVSYALEQAVRWSRMPLPALVSELIPNRDARDTFFQLIGVRERTAGEAGGGTTPETPWGGGDGGGASPAAEDSWD